MSPTHSKRQDRRLWATWEFSRVSGMGVSWFVEGWVPDTGFNQQATGSTSSMWGAKRKVRRYLKQWREEAHGA